MPDLPDTRIFTGPCLAAVVERLPAPPWVEVLADALGKAKSADECRALAEGLAAVTSGLSKSRRIQLSHASGFAALYGAVTLHPAVLPKHKALPPQQLVELLKHPFVVKEARRAVLDALEFTYDRKFTDLWDFVAFAEKEHPELDLLTPPKRPVKK